MFSGDVCGDIYSTWVQVQVVIYVYSTRQSNLMTFPNQVDVKVLTGDGNSSGSSGRAKENTYSFVWKWCLKNSFVWKFLWRTELCQNNQTFTVCMKMLSEELNFVRTTKLLQLCMKMLPEELNPVWRTECCLKIISLCFQTSLEHQNILSEKNKQTKKSNVILQTENITQTTRRRNKQLFWKHQTIRQTNILSFV